MTNNIEPILDFIVLDDEQAPVLNEHGFPKLKQGPITKPIADLIEKGKVENIEIFAQLTSDGEQYEWASEYLEYLKLLAWVENQNANLPESVANEDGIVTLPEKLELPMAPIRPEVRTVEQVLEPFSKAISKLKGIEFKDVNIALTETNQNGLSALKSALELAKEFDVDNQFFPINFNAETCSGVEVVELLNEIEFKQFGLDFIMARKAFFE